MRQDIKEADEILDLYFPVLDHGYVALKDYCGGDHATEQAARVSYGRGTRSISDTNTLIRYLVGHRHTTPLEMTELTFHIAMPIFVARQYFRHRTFNFNEYSGRYSEIPDIFYTPDNERITKQSKDNKQGSSEEQVYTEEEYELFLENRSAGGTFDEYKERLELGWAKELARIDLPVSTYTYFYCKCDLHNLLHFLGLRCDSHAQKEIRDFANVMAGMVKRVAPLAFQAWVDYQFTAKSFSRMELNFLDYLSSFDGDWKDKRKEYEREMPGFQEFSKLSKREYNEFFEKLKPIVVPDFNLDLSLAKTAEEMEKK